MRIVLVVVLMFGCGGESDRRARVEAAIAKMAGFRDDMCRCRNKACADQVQEAMVRWGTEMSKTARPLDEKPDPAAAKQSAEIMTVYTDCMAKLLLGPDVPVPAEAEPAPTPN